MDELVINQTTLKLVQGNIVAQKVEAIVNAANKQLAGGGGVDGAIHKAAGTQELLALTRPFRGCPTGEAVITTAGKMLPPLKYIIHAVGPVYDDGRHGEPALLASAYRRSLELADEKQVASIAFPAISTGVYGYPMLDAATVALTSIMTYIQQHNGQTAPATKLKEILFVLFDVIALDLHELALSRLTK